jgi:hypothetical protein
MDREAVVPRPAGCALGLFPGCATKAEHAGQERRRAAKVLGRPVLLRSGIVTGRAIGARSARFPDRNCRSPTMTGM